MTTKNSELGVRNPTFTVILQLCCWMHTLDGAPPTSLKQSDKKLKKSHGAISDHLIFIFPIKYVIRLAIPFFWLWYLSKGIAGRTFSRSPPGKKWCVFRRHFDKGGEFWVCLQLRCAWKPGGSSLAPYYKGILDTPFAPNSSLPFARTSQGEENTIKHPYYLVGANHPHLVAHLLGPFRIGKMVIHCSWLLITISTAQLCLCSGGTVPQ